MVGCGRMGQIRTEGVLANPGTRLVSVVDPNREQATALAQKAAVPAFWWVVCHEETDVDYMVPGRRLKVQVVELAGSVRPVCCP